MGPHGLIMTASALAPGVRPRCDLLTSAPEDTPSLRVLAPLLRLVAQQLRIPIPLAERCISTEGALSVAARTRLAWPWLTINSVGLCSDGPRGRRKGSISARMVLRDGRSRIRTWNLVLVRRSPSWARPAAVRRARAVRAAARRARRARVLRGARGRSAPPSIPRQPRSRRA
jgi:hypothetical protein